MNKLINILLIVSVVVLSGCSGDMMNAYSRANPDSTVVEVPTCRGRYFIVDKTDTSYIFKHAKLDCNGKTDKIYNSISYEELQLAVANNHSWKTVKVKDTIEISSPVIWRLDKDEIIYFENNRFKWIYEYSSGNQGGAAELCNLGEYTVKSDYASVPANIITKTVYITNVVDIIAETNNTGNTGNTVQQVSEPRENVLDAAEKYRTIDFNFHRQ